MKTNLWIAATLLVAPPCSLRAEQATRLSAVSDMPVREVTIFKDGHAMALHSGELPTDADGNVVLDHLPSAVLGTFWPYSADKSAKIVAVTASPKKVLVERTALSLRELVEANVGAEVMVTETPPGGDRSESLRYRATILGVPARSGEELESASPPHSGEKLPQKGDMVLLKTDQGTKAVNIARVADLTFLGDHKDKLATEEFRNLLTLQLTWPENKPRKTADVGLLYVQRGLRWIPGYKVTIDGKGSAAVKLQATLVNELVDLKDVTAHLVIGVPTFAFKDTVDPMALQEAAARLSQYFQENSQARNFLSNAIMTQQARMTELRQAPEGGGGQAIDLGPEIASSGKSEDLFVFAVKHVTLKKGHRMVLPVAEFTLRYRDVHVLEIPFTPPPEVRQGFDQSRQAELASLLHAPKVTHKIRLSNTSEYPLTTAPALVLAGDRVLSQGLMTYTAIGADTDLELTTAVDVRVKKEDNEVQRTPNAAVWQKVTYGRIDLEGSIQLTSFAKEPVEVEVVRHVLGNVTAAEAGGKVAMVNVFEDAAFAPSSGYPQWWHAYSWPFWWHHFNGIGRITWTVKLEPNTPKDLKYQWNYYWR